MKENNSFLWGIRDGIPIALGYISVSFAFGILASSLGLSILEATFISLFNMTSAGQLAAVPIIATLGSYLELALSQLVINMRYALMSVSLSQKFGKSVKFADRFAFAFVNTDEVFAVATGRPGTVGRRYMYGLIFPPVIGWTLGTALGAIAGNILPSVITTALGVAIYAMFVAIVTPAVMTSKNNAMLVLLSAILSSLFYYVPFLKENIQSGFVIIICAAVASTILALVAPVPDEPEEDAYAS